MRFFLFQRNFRWRSNIGNEATSRLPHPFYLISWQCLSAHCSFFIYACPTSVAFSYDTCMCVCVCRLVLATVSAAGWQVWRACGNLYVFIQYERICKACQFCIRFMRFACLLAQAYHFNVCTLRVSAHRVTNECAHEYVIYYINMYASVLCILCMCCYFSFIATCLGGRQKEVLHIFL